jgi:hypothetical protein
MKERKWRRASNRRNTQNEAEEVIQGKEILFYRFFLTLEIESTPKPLSD